MEEIFLENIFSGKPDKNKQQSIISIQNFPYSPSPRKVQSHTFTGQSNLGTDFKTVLLHCKYLQL